MVKASKSQSPRRRAAPGNSSKIQKTGGNGKAAGRLQGRALRKYVVTLIGQLGHAEEQMRESAINALAAVGDKAVHFLIPMLDDADTVVRLSALQALGDIGEPAKEIVPWVLTALRDGVAKMRFFAAWALSRLGDRSRKVVQALVAALGDPEPRVRRQAARTLGWLGEAAAEAVRPLRHALGSRDLRMQHEAAVALAKIGEPSKDVVRILLRALKTRGVIDYRREAIVALGYCGEMAKEALSALRLLQRHRDASLHEAVAWAIAQIRAPGGRERPGSLGRNSLPTPGRSNKGNTQARWEGLLALVEIFLKLKPGEPVGQRALSDRLLVETETYYAPKTVGNYMETIEGLAEQDLFLRPEPHSGDPTTLLSGASAGLKEAQKIIEANLDLCLPSWREDRRHKR